MPHTMSNAYTHPLLFIVHHGGTHTVGGRERGKGRWSSLGGPKASPIKDLPGLRREPRERSWRLKSGRSQHASVGGDRHVGAEGREKGCVYVYVVCGEG